MAIYAYLYLNNPTLAGSKEKKLSFNSAAFSIYLHLITPYKKLFSPISKENTYIHQVCVFIGKTDAHKDTSDEKQKNKKTKNMMK